MKPGALALTVLLCSAASAAEGTGEVAIVVRGNLVLPDAVYRTVLGAQAGPPTMALVDQLVDRTTAFLHDSGYRLAAVDGHIEGSTVVLTVNEGLLDRVVFRGRLTFQMIRLKLALDLPHEVYNGPHLAAQLVTLARQLGIDTPSYELVPSAVVRHEGPQVDTLGPLGTIIGVTLVKPRQQYELHVFFTEREWNVGFGFDVRTSYFDGLELGGNYQGRDLLFKDDRWRVALMGGAGLRRDIPTANFYVFPSRVFAEAQYFTPALARVVRSFLWLRSEGLARQRPELRLENVYSVNSELSANVQVQPLPELRLAVGFGVQHFYLAGEQAPAGDPPLPARVDQRWRGFVRLGVDVLFDDGYARWDRRHALELEGRLFTNLFEFETVNYSEVRLVYQKVFALGWHDLWIRSRGVWLSGDVLYPFEEALGEHLRSVFGDVYTRAALGAKVEFRYSLTRDLFKLGAFLDGAAYSQRDALTGRGVPRFGLAAGPSFHALVVGMFQLDLAVSFGVLSTGRFNTGLYAVVVKVF